MLQRASAQTINNLLFSEEVVTFYEGKNDRVKYLVLLSTSEDIELSKAASGSLAILTSVSKRASRKVFEVFLSTRQIYISLQFFKEIPFYRQPNGKKPCATCLATKTETSSIVAVSS